MKKDSWTLLEVLRWTTSRFEERGLATPRLDAEILIAAALGLSRVQLYVQFERPLDPAELAAIREHVRRRQAGESVAYIVGRKEFFGLDFAVDSRVLVPRPDTETLVDEVLERLRERASEVPALSAPVGPDAGDGERGSDRAAESDFVGETPPPPAMAATTVKTTAWKVADVGTGSGAIAVTLAKQLPQSAIFAVDIEPGALEVARGNADRHAVTVTFLQGDLAAPLPAHGPFDLIAANLPYVATAELADLAPEVQGEPRRALDGGPDGLDLVRRLIAAAPPLLVPGGALVLEIGAGQAEQTAALCREAGLGDIRRRRDLGAIERVVSAVKG